MEENKNINTFEILNNINLNDKTKEKIGLKYLSWAYAWGELKKAFPDASYIIYDRDITTTEEIITKEDGYEKKTTITTTNTVPYFTDGKTCFVKVGVNINGVEYIEQFPIMDNKNNSVPYSSITMVAVNKALQRAFVKACARHGLGLYIYAGEDLPEAEKTAPLNIDFNAIAIEVSNAAFNPIEEPQFKLMLGDIINKVQNVAYVDEVKTGISNYIVSINQGKRLSQLSYSTDCLMVQKIDAFIKKVESQLDRG